MLLEDLLAIESPHDRSQRMWKRLIPLCQPAHFGARPESVRTFFAVFMILGEAHNGSLHQYFSNSAGDYSEIALEGLERMKLKPVAALFREALGIFKGGPSKDRGERNEQLGKLSPTELKRLEELSTKICDRADDFHRGLADLIAESGEDFSFIDRHPNGFKALPLPAEIDLDEVLAGTAPERLQGAFTTAKKTPAANAFRLSYQALGHLLQGDLYGYVDNVKETPKDTLGALRTTGLAEPADAMKKVLDHFGKKLPKTADDLEALLKSWEPAAMKALGKSLRELNALEAEIVEGLDDYVRRHPKDCPVPPPEPFRVVTMAFASIMDKKGKLTEPEKSFLDVFHLADEVSCGGFESYFFIRAADRHDETMKALKELKLEKTEKLLGEAVATLPSPFSHRHLARREQLRSLAPKAKEQLEFYQVKFQEQRREVAEALAKYVGTKFGS